MTVTEPRAVASPEAVPEAATVVAPTATERPRDYQRTFRLVLASIWLLDAVLQIQPFMFTPGSSGFSGMLSGVGAGNPSWVAHSITWDAGVVAAHPVVTNTAFALVQFLIAFGIVYRRTCKAALVLSIAWSLGVWWFGEGLGGLLHGAATPLGGGPGAVLFYAILAVILWPSDGSDLPFVAARTVGARAAKGVWVAVWGGLALLAVIGSGRSPQALTGVVSSTESGQPGWLVHLDRYTGAILLHHGTPLAVALSVMCLLVALAVFLPAATARACIVLAVAVFSLIWLGVENAGGILAGGATDPNSGPLVVLFALCYWPLDRARYEAATRTDRRARPGASCC